MKPQTSCQSWEMAKRTYTDFDNFFEFQFKLLKFVGIWFDLSENQKPKKIYFIVIQKLYYFFCVFVLLLFSGLLILFIFYTNAKIDLKLRSLPIFISNVVIITKLVIIALDYGRIVDIMMGLKDLYKVEQLHEAQGSENSDKRYLHRNARIIFIFIRITIFFAIFFSITPIITTILTYRRKGVWVAVFPFQIYYPFDPAPYYLPIYMLHLFYGYSFMLYSVATDSMLFMILNHLNGQLMRISNELEAKTFGPEKMKELVDRHVKILG